MNICKRNLRVICEFFNANNLNFTRNQNSWIIQKFSSRVAIDLPSSLAKEEIQLDGIAFKGKKEKEKKKGYKTYRDLCCPLFNKHIYIIESLFLEQKSQEYAKHKGWELGKAFGTHLLQ